LPLIRLDFFLKKSHSIVQWDTIRCCFVLTHPTGA
jgi:hypothetical protein